MDEAPNKKAQVNSRPAWNLTLDVRLRIKNGNIDPTGH
jgi:hypothetical protein